MPEPEYSLKKLERLIIGVQPGRIRQFKQAGIDQDQDLDRLIRLEPRERRALAQEIYNRQQDMGQMLQDMQDRQEEQENTITHLKNLQRTTPLSALQLSQLQNFEQQKDLLDDEVEESQEFFDRQESLFQKRLRQNPEASILPGGRIRHGLDRMFLGMSFNESSDGGYFKISGNGPNNPYTMSRELSDRQIQEAILRLVKEEKCDTLYFYKGNDIDPKATDRARRILSKMMDKGHVLEGYNVNISDSRMKELEPWLRGNNPITRALLEPIAQWSRDRKLGKEFAKAYKDDQASLKSETNLVNNRPAWWPSWAP